ncbi:GIY-YIG nuclease family protein [Aeromonas salmonicida]|uniref:GIY-YIG nuclease family protein n=1 Tax=Aeromonas salmonicida TaxID=645 RepID=UPI00232EEF5E|nr:GIY-YIG nuclease family protein [Aeromonas salmonicida]WCH23338.1 GIY-YIG nuclease family protein [Aeromonas salmonicida]
MRKSTMDAEPTSSPPTGQWSLYLVRTAAGLLYTGISTDPIRRLRQHQNGKGSRALRGKGPLVLVWQQTVGDKGAALRLEYRLKQQSKAFKERLVQEPDGWADWSQPWLTVVTPPLEAPQKKATASSGQGRIR